MAEKNLKARIVHKHDVEVNWLLATNFIPKQGEVIVYDIDNTHSYERFKIGDGEQNVNDLPFANDALRAELLEQINSVNAKIGDISVADQIDAAIAEIPDVESKMDKENPVGVGSLSMNRKSGSNEGISSTTLGWNGSASGNYALAEGAFTSASGYAAHAEGYNTNATRHAQHVEGQYNILDTEGTTKGKYIHIVGNGTAIDARSNAHTIDWDGNAWFQGTVKIGGTGQDDTAAKELATKEYVDTAISDFAPTVYWDSIKYKPFIEGDFIIEWDGDLTGMAYVGHSDNRYYRTSYSVVKACDFAEGRASLSVVDAALNTPITEQIPMNNVREEDGILVVGDYNIISVPYDNMILSINYDTVTFPSAGTYFRYIPDAFYISTLTITNTDHKILSENLPDGVASKAELIQHHKNSTWTQIYNSGSTNKNVNAFSGIDIEGYTKLRVAIKCVNVSASSGTTSGAVIFTGEDGVDYSFSTLFGNLISKTSGTAGAMAEFTIVDGFIICDNALRSTSAADMLSTTSGKGAWGLTNVGGGLISCDVPVYAMKIATTNMSTTHYYGSGSKVIVWGCKE